MVSHEAIKQFPEFSSAYEEIADIYERKGDKEPAIKNYQTALKLDPKSDVAKKGLDRLSPSTKQP